MTIENAIKLQDTGWTLVHKGKIADGLKQIEEALRLFELIEGSESPDVANLLNDIAEIENNLERFKLAITHATRSMEITDKLGRKFTGEDAARIRARSRTILGTVHRELGDYKLGESYLKDALKINKKQFGDEDPETATSQNNLAIVYKYMGHIEKGLALYQDALRKLIAEYGEDALALSPLYHNIGGILHAAGRYAEAEEPGRKAWEISKAALGRNNPQTVADGAAYAGILDGLGRYKESEPIYKHALKRFEKLYGPDNYEIAVNLNNLAALKAAQGKNVEAEAHYRRSIEIKEKLFGKSHPDIALALNNLGSLLNGTGRHKEAVVVYKRALKMFEKTLKKDHPKLKLVRENLAGAEGAGKKKK